MAMFQRMFSSNRASRRHSENRRDQLQKDVTPKLDKSKIRLVICADTERGRTPFFDSNAIRLAEETAKDIIRTAPKTVRSKPFINSGHKEASTSNHRQTPKYHFQKLGNDIKVLEEMMFGTVAMAFKGLTVKVHLLRWAKRSPPQLMVSNVFCPEKPRRGSTMDVESDANSLTGVSSDFSSGEYSFPIVKATEKYAKSIPVDVPTTELLSDHSIEDDSGLACFTASGNLRASLPSPSNGSISSYSSLHRRWMRAQTTSLNGIHRPDSALAFENSPIRPQRHKLAVGIIFGSSDDKDEENNELFQSFFFSHFALVEGHVEKLRCIVEKAYFNPRSFLPAVMEALDTFRSDIYDLYMAPRLPEPAWLTMISATTYKIKLCDRFMETFVWLVNNFVSTLLSAVLTEHLAWVATVTPADGTPFNTYLDKHTAKWVNTLTKSHPYNPLWAQMGDLFGALGFPRKISRTVVIGKKANMVKRFLYLLSYFIRCSELQENTDLQCLSNIVNDCQFELSPTSTHIENTLTDVLKVSPSFTTAGITLARQTNINNNNVSGFSCSKVIDVNSRQEEAGVENAHVDGNSESVASCMVESTSTVHVQNHCQTERRDSADNVSNFESSCDQEQGRINSVCADNIDFAAGTASGISKCGQISPVPFYSNSFLFRDYQQFSPINSDSSVSLGKSNHINEAKNASTASVNSSHIKERSSQSTSPVTSNHINETKNIKNNSFDSSLRSQIQSLYSTSTASKPMGMSELYINSTNSFSPCSLTSATLLTSHIEQICPVDKLAPDTKHVDKDFSITGSELVSTSKTSTSFSEGKVKSRLTQQLGEGISNIGDAEDKDIIPSLVSPDKFPVESRNEIDSLSKLYVPTQNSQDHISPTGRLHTLTKSRSTLTESYRWRHLSSTGSIDYEAFEPTVHCKEIKIPDPLEETDQWHVQAFDRNFGHSLLADYTDHYMSDFVLHGTSDANYKLRLLNDLQMSVKHSILDEPINEAVCVIADTDNWTVEVASSKVMGISPSGCTTWTASQLVADLIESVVEIYKLKLSAEFCLMHLEDRLREIYFKSLILSENLRSTTTYNQQELTDILGCHSSDMPLLQGVAGTHTPSFVLGSH